MKEFQNLPNQEPERAEQNKEANASVEATEDVNEIEKPKVVEFREHKITIPPEKKKEE